MGNPTTEKRGQEIGYLAKIYDFRLLFVLFRTASHKTFTIVVLDMTYLGSKI